jgi:hypothetical protein
MKRFEAGDGAASQNPDIRRLLEIGVLCSETVIEQPADSQEPPVVTGSATEVALAQVAIDTGCDVLEVRKRFPLRTTQYRSETQNLMMTLTRLAAISCWPLSKEDPTKSCFDATGFWKAAKSKS